MSCRKERNGMAEMTVQEAIDEIDNWVFTVGKGFRAGQRLMSVISLIEQQAAEIATSEQKYKNWIGPIEHRSLLDEIAKKDRMLNKACKRLSMTNMSIRTEKQWLSWLEKEAQEVE